MIKKIIETKLAERFEQDDLHDCFLIEIRESPLKNKLAIFVDSDSGMTLEKCRIISKYLQYYLEEEQLLGENYELEVSSPGVDRPLLNIRQYNKNIGRNIEVTNLENNRLKGKLYTVKEEGINIIITLAKKEAKRKGKKEEEIFIPFSEIKESKIKVSFK